MQPVQLRFTYTEPEYLSASRLLITRETKIVVRLIAMFLLFFCLEFLLTRLVPAFTWFPLWVILLIALVFAALFLRKLFVDMPRKYFRGNTQARGEYQLTFSDEGVWVQTTGIDSKLAWSLYTGVLENSSMYVIVYGKDARMMTAVPKRAFRSAEEEVAFRNLLGRYVDQSLPPTNASIDARAYQYVPSGTQPPDWR